MPLQKPVPHFIYLDILKIMTWLSKRSLKIICIAVNDPNVMKAWGENQKVGDKILMVGDPFLNLPKL